MLTTSVSRTLRQRLAIGIALVALSLPGAALAQPKSPVTWSLVAPAATAADGTATATVTAAIDPGWHLYSISQPPGGPITTTIVTPEASAFERNGDITGPAPKRFNDPNFDNLETEYYDTQAVFRVPVRVKAGVGAGSQALAVAARFQACNDTSCTLPRTVTMTAAVAVPAGVSLVAAPAAAAGTRASSVERQPGGSTVVAPTTDPVAPAPGGAAAAAPTTVEAPVGAAPTAGPTAPPPSPATPASAAASGQQQDLGSFLKLAILMGALSLLTPCVFPMIPVTVSYFTKHASGSRGGAVRLATIYALGIILTFTVLGVALAVLAGAAGLNRFAANPWVNIAIAALFIVFAMNLFGSWVIQPPQALTNRINASARARGTNSAVGALLMGGVFTLTSFTCTSPFLGTLLVLAAQGEWTWPVTGMLAFSSVFALPFFVLALAPQLVSQLPKAGGWMTSVKVVMGFLEIAAAMKFLSNADLVWGWQVLTRDVVLAVWVGIGVLVAAYVLGMFRVEDDAPVERVSGWRLAFAIVTLGVTVWLFAGIFGRSLGELESFLPPALEREQGTSSSGGLSTGGPSLSWITNDRARAFDDAKASNRLVFVDFTGYTCTNCRWMEANMFTKPDVMREMQRFVRLKLYTDGDGEPYDTHRTWLEEGFQTVALPFYAILRPDGSPAATFAGLTRNRAEFVTFLKQPQ